MNTLIIRGNLTKDCFYKENDKGSMALGTIAVANGKDNTNFVDFVAYEKSATFLKEYGKKGQNFIFIGRLKTENIKDGDKYYCTCKMVVNQVEFGTTKASEDKPSAKKVEHKVEQDSDDAEDGDYLLDDDNVPF